MITVNSISLIHLTSLYHMITIILKIIMIIYHLKNDLWETRIISKRVLISVASNNKIFNTTIYYFIQCLQFNFYI